MPQRERNSKRMLRLKGKTNPFCSVLFTPTPAHALTPTCSHSCPLAVAVMRRRAVLLAVGWIWPLVPLLTRTPSRSTLPLMSPLLTSGGSLSIAIRLSLAYIYVAPPLSLSLSSFPLAALSPSLLSHLPSHLNCSRSLSYPYIATPLLRLFSTRKLTTMSCAQRAWTGYSLRTRCGAR